MKMGRRIGFGAAFSLLAFVATSQAQSLDTPGSRALAQVDNGALIPPTVRPIIVCATAADEKQLDTLDANWTNLYVRAAATETAILGFKPYYDAAWGRFKCVRSPGEESQTDIGNIQYYESLTSQYQGLLSQIRTARDDYTKLIDALFAKKCPEPQLPTKLVLPGTDKPTPPKPTIKLPAPR